MRKHILFVILALLCVSNASAQGIDVYSNRHIPKADETPEETEAWKRNEELGRGLFLIEKSNEHRYSSALTPKEKSKKWGFANGQGKMVIKARYDKVEPFSEGLALVMKDGKYGFINESGDLVIEMKYDDATSFFYNTCHRNGGNHLAICRLNDCYGIINSDGTTYLNFEYSNIQKFNNLSCLATKKGSNEADTYIFMGGSAFVYKFDNVSFLQDAIIKAEKNGKILLVDIDGDMYSGMSFDEFEDFDGNGLAVVKKGDKYGLLQSDLFYKVPCECSYYEFHQGKHIIGKSIDSYGIYDEGKEIVPYNSVEPQFFPFSDAVTYKKANGRFDVKTFDETVYFKDAKAVECTDESGTTLSVKYDGCSMIWEALDGIITVTFGNTEIALPRGSKNCVFDGAIVRFVGPDGFNKYLSKTGKRLTYLEEETIEVRTLNSKYLAVCLAFGQRKTKKMQEQEALYEKYRVSAPRATYVGWPIWVVANAEGEIITGDKQFVAIGEFDAKGNLSYQVIDKNTYQPKSGIMRFNGNKVTYAK